MRITTRTWATTRKNPTAVFTARTMEDTYTTSRISPPVRLTKSIVSYLAVHLFLFTRNPNSKFLRGRSNVT